MLDEEMRILVGLQESKNVENPLPAILEAQKQREINERQRLRDEKQTVITHFDVFRENIEKYQSMILMVTKLFDEKNTKEFISGLCEAKYKKLRHFADMVINDGFTNCINYLEEHYYSIKDEVDAIIVLNETIDMNHASTYFVAQNIISNDFNHHLNINVYKNKTLEEKISNEILYGSQLIYLGENLTVVRYDGKRLYTRFSKKQIEYLEKKGFLI